MKKLMTAMAICAAASYTLAAGSVTSANVVGYAAKSLSANKAFMYGMNFAAIGGSSLTFADLKPSIGFNDGDQIQISFVSGAQNKIGFNIYTYYTSDPNEEGGPAGWYDGGFNYAASTILSNGIACWIKTSVSQNITVAGEVLAASATQQFQANKARMVASFYPVAINPNNLAWTGLTTGDQIQISFVSGAQNKIGFNIYTYYATDPNEEGGPAGWYDGGFNYVTTEIIAPGIGFWVKCASAASYTQNSPL